MARFKVAEPDELAPGEMTSVDAGGRELLLARVEDEYFALDNLCTHAEGWLDMGFLLPESCEVNCPLHEGRFDLRTGAATHEPAVEPVEAFKVEQAADGIYIIVDPA